MTLLINMLGLLLIGFIAWWFWGHKKSLIETSEGLITITVESGSYSPSVIKIVPDQSAMLEFVRKDDNPCSATVLFPDMDLTLDLPLGTPVQITLPALTKGEYAFNCQMNMYKGKILVVD